LTGVRTFVFDIPLASMERLSTCFAEMSHDAVRSQLDPRNSYCNTLNLKVSFAFMKTTAANPDFLNGVPELVILRLLAGRPMYGYELVQQIRLSSDEELTFGEGCVYPILHRLEAQGHLTSKRENVGGRSRVIYRVSSQGKARLSQATAEWQRVVAAFGSVLQGGTHATPPGIAANPA